MSKTPSEAELEDALKDLAEAMYLVFDNDWQFTEISLGDDLLMPESGTFLQPGVDDESNNWANRGNLLEAYRRARDLLSKRGIKVEV